MFSALGLSRWLSHRLSEVLWQITTTGDGYSVCTLSLIQDASLPRLSDLNLPICGVSIVLVLIFLHLPTPPGTLKEKLGRMDWM